MEKKIFSTYNLTATAVLLALVILFQTVLGSIPLGAVNLSFVLVPIVMGAVTIGIWSGAFLGFMFGVIAIIMGLTGADPFTNILINVNPWLIVALCLVKGTATGIVSGLIFKLLQNKNRYVAVIVSAVSAPIVNTGLFFLGIFSMSDIIVANEIAVSFGAFVGAILLTNFIAELLINAIFAPGLYRAYEAITKHGHFKNQSCKKAGK